MSTPVLADDLIQGVVKHLAEQADVRAVLGAYPGGDVPWLFQHTLFLPVEGTSSTAAVLTRNGGWAGPNLHNTMRFPRLGLELWCDPQRDAAGHVSDPGEAQRRILHALWAIDTHLHLPAGGDRFWGTVRVVSSIRLNAPDPYLVPDGGGLLRVAVFYAVTEA